MTGIKRNPIAVPLIFDDPDYATSSHVNFVNPIHWNSISGKRAPSFCRAAWKGLKSEKQGS
jgi:hypothetical protein